MNSFQAKDIICLLTEHEGDIAAPNHASSASKKVRHRINLGTWLRRRKWRQKETYRDLMEDEAWMEVNDFPSTRLFVEGKRLNCEIQGMIIIAKDEREGGRGGGKRREKGERKRKNTGGKERVKRRRDRELSNLDAETKQIDPLQPMLLCYVPQQLLDRSTKKKKTPGEKDRVIKMKRTFQRPISYSKHFQQLIYKKWCVALHTVHRYIPARWCAGHIAASYSECPRGVHAWQRTLVR